MTDDTQELVKPERKPIQERRRLAEIEGREAMAEIEARDAFVRTNMEKLRALRLASEAKNQAKNQAKAAASARATPAKPRRAKN